MQSVWDCKEDIQNVWSYYCWMVNKNDDVMLKVKDESMKEFGKVIFSSSCTESLLGIRIV